MEEDSLPMVGAEIRPLSEEMVEAIINFGLDRSTGTPLTHRTFETLPVILDNRALLTTHFGIFGFTNAGKSNLISSLVTSLIWRINKGIRDRSPLNIILIDPNDEYLGLFMDQLQDAPGNFRYIHVGFDSLPEPIVTALDNDQSILSEDDLQLLYKQMKLRNVLKKYSTTEKYFKDGLRKAIKRTKIAVPYRNLASWISDEVKKQTPPNAGPPVKMALQECIITGRLL
jgi:hypothetical protein